MNPVEITSTSTNVTLKLLILFSRFLDPNLNREGELQEYFGFSFMLVVGIMSMSIVHV